jgi:hypothetical protein
MASEILGLFTSPQDYQMRQQQQQQMERNQALQFAQLNPFERANFGIYQGAQQLGNATAGLFGMQDPQLKLISQRQMLSQEIDPSDPESILRVAQRASQLNDQPFALQLSDYARKMQSEMALTGQRTAQANKEYRQSIPNDLQITQERAKYNAALRELKALPPSEENTAKINYLNDVLAGLPLPGAAKPIDKIEINKQLTALRKEQGMLPPGPSPQRAELQAQIDFLSDAKEGKANILEIGTAKGTEAPVYLDVNNDRQFIYTKDANGKQVRQDYTGGVDRTTARVSATANTGVGEKEVVKGLAGLDVEDIKIARTNKRTAIASNQALQKLSSLNDQGLTTGAFASNRVGAANLLNSLGLLSQKDASELAASQQYQKVGADLIFQSLQGKLGAGISNADRDFIRELFPQLETSAAARRKLIEYIADKNNAIIKEADSAEAYVRKNKSLEGYKPLVEGVFDARVSANVRSYTREELEAAIAKKKREQEQNKGK